jgi:hypothetical protein
MQYIKYQININEQKLQFQETWGNLNIDIVEQEVELGLGQLGFISDLGGPEWIPEITE